MNFSKFAKFRTVGKKPTIQKFPAQKTPKIQDQYLKLIQKSQQNKKSTTDVIGLPNAESTGSFFILS